MAKQKTLSKKKMTSPTHQVDGKIESIGDHGQLITSIENGILVDAGQDESVCVKFDAHSTVGVYPEDHGQPDATLVASMGRSGFLEIEIVGVSLSEMIKAGGPVSVSW